MAAADSVRGTAVFALYCIDFMLSQRLIPRDEYLVLLDRFGALESSMKALAFELREELVDKTHP